jgi:hypothetical protein
MVSLENTRNMINDSRNVFRDSLQQHEGFQVADYGLIQEKTSKLSFGSRVWAFSLDTHL